MRAVTKGGDGGRYPLSAVCVAGMAAMVSAGAVAFAMTAFCGDRHGWLLGAAALGLLFAATYRTWVEAAVLAASSSLLGAMLARAAFSSDLLERLARQSGRGVPEALNATMLPYLYTLGRANVVLRTSALAFVLLSVVVAAAVAAGAALLVRSAPRKRIARTAVAGGVVALTIASMWFGAQSPDINALLSRPYVAGEYRHDALIYLNTYLAMTKGKAFYPAIRDAAAGDIALIEGGYIKNGRFTGWAHSPASIRLPYAFHLWRHLAPGGGSALYVVSLILASIVLIAAFVALLPRVGPAAALVPMLLMPYVQASPAVGGLFMPDLWAGMFLTLGFLAWTRERYLLGGALALAASLCRETAAVALVIFVGWAAYRALRGDAEWRARALALGGLLAAFALAYWLHLRAGAPYFAPGGQNAAGTVRMMVTTSAQRSLFARFVSPTLYGSVFFTAVFVPAWPFVLVQLPGWFVAMRPKWDVVAVVSAYAIFWLAFTLTVGATSAYWGLLYMPLAIIGSALLFAWAGANGQCWQASKAGAVSWYAAGVEDKTVEGKKHRGKKGAHHRNNRSGRLVPR